MQITSTNFQNNEPIPARFSRDGEDINPSLTFSELPEDARSLTLIMEDPDAPEDTFTHWIIYDMTPGVLQIVEGEMPISGKQGLNDYGETGYGGPKPPSGTHRYFFKLFALDTMLEPNTAVDRTVLYQAMDGHVIDQAQIIGTYGA